MWQKRKPKKDLCTVGRSHFVLIADYEYYLVHCWTCVCNAFSCAKFIFPVDHPPPLFFLPKIVQKICLSKNFVIVALLARQSYYTSCFLFLSSDSFSHCSFTTYFRCIFMQKLSRPLELWSEVKRVFFEPGETQKLLKVTNHFWVTSTCLFNHSEYCCPFWSTRDNHEFWKLQFSRILSDKIRWAPTTRKEYSKIHDNKL